MGGANDPLHIRNRNYVWVCSRSFNAFVVELIWKTKLAYIPLLLSNQVTTMMMAALWCKIRNSSSSTLPPFWQNTATLAKFAWLLQFWFSHIVKEKNQCSQLWQWKGQTLQSFDKSILWLIKYNFSKPSKKDTFFTDCHFFLLDSFRFGCHKQCSCCGSLCLHMSSPWPGTNSRTWYWRCEWRS